MVSGVTFDKRSMKKVALQGKQKLKNFGAQNTGG